jgi:hypothetical protein
MPFQWLFWSTRLIQVWKFAPICLAARIEVGSMEAKNKVTVVGRAMIGGRLGLQDIKSTSNPTITDQLDSFSIFSWNTFKNLLPKKWFTVQTLSFHIGLT